MANIDDKYIALQKWMVTQLELSGNELIIYGYIYSFQFKSFWGKETPDKVTPTEIPLRDFMDWTKSNKKNTILAIQRLQAKGYIEVVTKPGRVNSYSVVSKVVTKAMGGVFTATGVSSDTSIKKTPVSKQHQGGVSSGTTSGVSIDTGVVSKQHQSGVSSDTTLNTNTFNTQKNTKNTARVARNDASASLSSTDTEDRYEDLSKTEIVFFEKQALKKLNETDETTGQKLYLTKDPRDQFPKAFLFMTAKNTSQFTDTEFELFKLVSMYTAFGPAKPLPTVSEEDARYVPPATKIGQEAHDAQQALVDWLFEGGPSPSSYAHDAPLQSRRQK